MTLFHILLCYLRCYTQPSPCIFLSDFSIFFPLKHFNVKKSPCLGSTTKPPNKNSPKQKSSVLDLTINLHSINTTDRNLHPKGEKDEVQIDVIAHEKTINITDGTDTHSIPFPFSPVPINEAVYLQSSGTHYGPCFDLQDSCQRYKPQTGKYITVRGERQHW